MPDPIFGGKPVSPLIVPGLERLLDALTPAERITVKRHVSKGRAGHDSRSGGTHADGCAVDFGTRRWSNALIRKVIRALHSAGFEAVLRLPGDELGPGVARVGAEHIHAVLKGHGNATLIAGARSPGDRRFVDKQLARR